MDIQQFIGDGSTLEFSFSFKIPKGGLVNVYKTLSGNQPNEINDLLPNTDYNLVYTDINADFTDGKVTFNTAPSNGDYITITPLPNGNTDIDFTAQNELSSDNLNLAFARHTTPINYSFGLYTDRSVRYAINVKQNEVNSYNTLLPALKDQAFWRRSGSNMIAQDYDDFVSEVSGSITNFRNELEQVTISNQSGTTFSLSDFKSGDVSQTTVEVFKNGLKLSITGDYTINSKNNTITFNTPLVNSDVAYVVKPLIKESNTFMDQDGDNANFTDNTMIAARDLSNVTTLSVSFLRIITDVLFPVGSVLIKNVNPSTVGFAGTWYRLHEDNAVTTTVEVNEHNTHKSGTSLNSLTATNDHILTEDELPEHTHDIIIPTDGEPQKVGTGNENTVFRKNEKYTTEPTGGGKGHSHNINVATVKLMMWIRVS